MNDEGLTPLDLAIVNNHTASGFLSHPKYIYAVDEEHNSEGVEVLLDRGASIVPERIPMRERHVLWPHLTPAELLRDNGDIDYYLLPLTDMNRTLRRALPGYGSWDGPLQPLSTAAISISLLHDAAFKGVSLVVEALLKSGASPTTAVRCASMPLHFAAAQGNVDIASMLLDWGADIDTSRTNAAGGHYPLYNPHNPHNSSPPALMDAITMGQVDMTRLLLARGRNI